MAVLSNTESQALSWIARQNIIFIYSVGEKNERDEFGGLIPGLALIKKLEEKGLVIITEEDPMDDGFEFTPTIELTEAGEQLLSQ